jgi:hypothetical protein
MSRANPHQRTRSASANAMHSTPSRRGWSEGCIGTMPSATGVRRCVCVRARVFFSRRASTYSERASASREWLACSADSGTCAICVKPESPRSACARAHLVCLAAGDHRSERHRRCDVALVNPKQLRCAVERVRARALAADHDRRRGLARRCRASATTPRHATASQMPC